MDCDKDTEMLCKKLSASALFAQFKGQHLCSVREEVVRYRDTGTQTGSISPERLMPNAIDQLTVECDADNVGAYDPSLEKGIISRIDMNGTIFDPGGLETIASRQSPFHIEGLIVVNDDGKSW
jgi:hypothetical protein